MCTLNYENMEQDFGELAQDEPFGLNLLITKNYWE